MWHSKCQVGPKTYLQVTVADALVTFQCRSACKVSGPKIMSVVGIREEIISLQRPEMKKEKTLAQ